MGVQGSLLRIQRRMVKTEPTTPVGSKVGPEFQDFEVRSNSFLLKAELVEVWSKKVS